MHKNKSHNEKQNPYSNLLIVSKTNRKISHSLVISLHCSCLFYKFQCGGPNKFNRANYAQKDWDFLTIHKKNAKFPIVSWSIYTPQKFSINDLFSKCD